MKKGNLYPEPLRFFLIISLSVLFAEIVIMILLSAFNLPYYLETLFDGLLLTILLSPVLYFFVYRPMGLYIKNIEVSQKEIKKLLHAVEQSPTTIIITDKEGNIEYTNPKFTELTGYSFEEVKGKNPRFLNSGEISAEIYKELWSTITSGKEWRGEFYNKKKTENFFGSLLPFLL